jgi:LysR family transcriptional regulator of gallate degradation
MYQLRHLVAVVDHGHIGRAAASLHVSQPAVSRSVKRLEAEVGNRLFERTAHGVTPTECGEVLAAHARGILNRTRQASSELQSMAQGRSGEVCFGVSDNLQDYVVPEVIAAWRRHHAGIDLSIDRVSSFELLSKLRTAEIDFGFGTLVSGRKDPDLVAEPLITDKILIYVRRGHPAVRRKTAAVRDVAVYDWAVLGLGDGATEFFNAHFAFKGIAPPRLALKTNSLHLVRQCVLSSDVIALVPRYFMQEYVDQGLAVCLPIPALELVVSVGLVLPRDRRLTPAQGAICDLIRAVSRDRAAAARGSPPHMLPLRRRA